MRYIIIDLESPKHEGSAFSYSDKPNDICLDGWFRLVASGSTLELTLIDLKNEEE